MNLEFKDDNLRRLYEEQEFCLPRIGPDLKKAFRKKANFLASAASLCDLKGYKALRFKQLKGNRKGQYAIRLNDQFRLIFHVENDKPDSLLIIVDIVDYH